MLAWVYLLLYRRYDSSSVGQGLTHTAVTPLDLVKCRRQVDAKMYKGNFEAWGKIGRAEGLRGIFTGWSPTFFGYSVRLSQSLIVGIALIDARPKVHSNMADMNSSRNSTRTWLDQTSPTVIRLLST